LVCVPAETANKEFSEIKKPETNTQEQISSILIEKIYTPDPRAEIATNLHFRSTFKKKF